MLFSQLFGKLLRLSMGCQVWISWQPGNPIIAPAISHSAALLHAAMSTQPIHHHTKKKKRSC